MVGGANIFLRTRGQEGAKAADGSPGQQTQARGRRCRWEREALCVPAVGAGTCSLPLSFPPPSWPPQGAPRSCCLLGNPAHNFHQNFASWLTSEYWLAMLKLWWLYNKNCLNFVLSRVRGTGSFKAAIPGPLTIQTPLSKVFLLYFWRSLDNHVFVYYTGYFLTQHIAGFWFMYLHKTLKVFCSESKHISAF